MHLKRFIGMAAVMRRLRAAADRTRDGIERYKSDEIDAAFLAGAL